MENNTGLKIEKFWQKGFISFANLRDVIILAFLIIATWKLIRAEVIFDLGNFDFSNLLALILAIFAISISAVFYFQATKTSNKFYDNLYKFTNKVSELLGRLEERLGYLGERYAGLEDKVDKIPKTPFDITVAKVKEKETEKEIKAKESEYKNIISGLLKKAKIAKEKQKELFEQLEEKQRELQRSKIAQIRLQNDIKNAELGINDIHSNFLRDLEDMTPKYVINESDEFLKNEFEPRKYFTSQMIRYMRKDRLLTPENKLSSLGVKVIRHVIEGV